VQVAALQDKVDEVGAASQDLLAGIAAADAARNRQASVHAASAWPSWWCGFPSRCATSPRHFGSTSAPLRQFRVSQAGTVGSAASFGCGSQTCPVQVQYCDPRLSDLGIVLGSHPGSWHSA
jgi:hypothetical protein